MKFVGFNFNANVIDFDPIADLAFLQLNGLNQKLATAVLENSAKIRPGKWVVALGSNC